MCIIENGNSIPSLDTFIKIAQTLHFDINDFFNISPEPLSELSSEIIEKIKSADPKSLQLIKDILAAVEKNY